MTYGDRPIINTLGMTASLLPLLLECARIACGRGSMVIRYSLAGLPIGTRWPFSQGDAAAASELNRTSSVE
jgi:hypothetical protein